MAWEIITTQNEAAWLDDYIRHLIAHEPPPLPPHDQKLGHVETHWHQVGAGIAYIASNPDTGTADDRLLAECLVREQLRSHGFKRAVYTLSCDHSDLTKHAGWSDIEDKARRLIQSGNVTILRNGADVIKASVLGDGTDNDGTPDMHQVEIHRDDPNSQAITGSHCDCGWGQFQNLPRTRQWKRFQDRPCSHVLAAYWQASAIPIDESRAPGNYGEPGQMSLFDMGGSQAPSSMGIMQQSPFNPNSWFAQPGVPEATPGVPPPAGMAGPPGGPQGVSAPSPEDVLPQFPMDPSLTPQVNPASVPGGRPGPTPTDPIQYPGVPGAGTFSRYHDDSFYPHGMMSRMAVDQAHQNGDLVQLLKDDMGTLVGRPESGQAGQDVAIPAGSVGEVLGTHPSTGMVNVLWMGKQFDANSYLEPFGASAWHFPSYLKSRPDLKRPGPAIRRTR